MELDRIITGDCRELSKLVPDKSIDLIFTDPPYIKKYMHLYDWLAEEGIRMLKDDGFLLTYVGTYWKFEVMKKLAKTLDYYYDFIIINRGSSPLMWTRKVISRHKSIIAYRKKGAQCHPNTNVLSSWVGGGEDKRFHSWGQDESSARYYISCFSKIGDTILDPFCGGGTTPAMCKILNRHFISFEVSEEIADRARARLLNHQPIMELEEEKQEVLV